MTTLFDRSGEGGPAEGAGSGEAPPATSDRRLVRLLSGDFFGVDGRPVEVQVDLSRRGSPGFQIVGLPGKSTRESRQRIRTAVQNSGFSFPHQDRILVNLAPAFQKKDGALFDLPVALGILLASGQVRCPGQSPSVALPLGFLGELGLQGELRPVPGALLVASALRDRQVRQVVVPESNAAEVALAPGIEVLAARDLHQAIAALSGRLEPYRRLPAPAGARDGVPDFADVRGQEATKRGILVAAAGGHHLLLVGPPGVGKTMLARRIPGILHPLSFEESLEVMKVYSARGHRWGSAFEGQRPFRAPHHTISYAGLVGGGTPPLPGEISLAHRGVLFLDELPEFQRRVLETLRQPLEAGRIAIVRSAGTVVFPARVLIVAAMNPCPCGYAGDLARPCHCTPGVIEKYRRRISGPLLDRIDIILDVLRPSASDILGPEVVAAVATGQSTRQMQDAVTRAVQAQGERWRGPVLNGQVSQSRLLGGGRMSRTARRHLEREAGRRSLSARALGRILRIARTVADLGDSPDVGEIHVAEALALHRADRSSL